MPRHNLLECFETEPGRSIVIELRRLVSGAGARFRSIIHENEDRGSVLPLVVVSPYLGFVDHGHIK